MPDVTISAQAISLVGTLLFALVSTISALTGAIIILYRQVLKERDGRLDERNRLLEERDARLIDLWRDLEAKEVRISGLEATNERLQKLAADATAGWRDAMRETARRMSGG